MIVVGVVGAVPGRQTDEAHSSHSHLQQQQQQHQQDTLAIV